MKRSLRFDRIPARSSLLSGGVAVATAFHHPRRGVVSCPAATLLGGELRRVGVAVEYSDWTDLTPSERDSTAPSVSYVDPDGVVRGLAVAAPFGKKGLTAGMLGRWADLLRSRRVVWAGTRPWCSGLAASLRTIDRLLTESGGSVFVLGVPPPRPAAEGLARRGAVFVERVDDIPNGARVIISSAGVALAARAELAARSMEVTDATCPVVTAAAQQVRTFAEEGETVVLVGGPSHAATPGLVGQAPERVVVTGSRSEAAAVEVADRRRVAVVMAPGAPLTRAVPVAEAVRRRFGQVLPQHSGSLCHEPSDRVAALRRLAAETDLVLVAGPAGQDSFEIGVEIKAAGTRCHQVASPEDIEPDWLRGTASVGITATLSAAPHLVERITSALGGLGPTTVVALAADTVPVTTTPSVGLTRV